jgi:hypothetical protein
MNIILPESRVSVTRADQIEMGRIYQVVGTDGFGVDIPPQIIRVGTPVIYRSILDVGYIRADFWTDLGAQGKHFHPGMLVPLDAINIPEHGLHDRHLRRIDDRLAVAHGLMKKANIIQDYTEMIVSV